MRTLTLTLSLLVTASIAFAQVRRMPQPPRMFGDHANIKMNFDRGIPTVEVMVNGQGPYLFGIDTGAQGYARISARLAEELGLTAVGKMRTGDPSGMNQRTVSVYKLDSLALGGLTFKGVAAEELSNARGLDGILAIGLFRNLLLTLDYGNGRLVATQGTLSDSEAPTVLRYTSGPRGSIRVPVQIGSFETLLNLDTGAAQVGIALPPEKLAKVKTRGKPQVIGRAKTASREFEISTIELAVPVTIGAVTLPVDSVTFPSPDPIGVIGSAALKGMSITIDQRHRLIQIEPSTR